MTTKENEAALSSTEVTARMIEVATAGLPEFMSNTLRRLEALEIDMTRLVGAIDALTAESIAARCDRTLFNLSFNDHRQALLDHELRLTRLERRAS